MSSNKLILKGALTVATGTALLVGGFGSFALWSEQDALPSDPISAGKLSLQAQTGSWVDESEDAANATWDPEADMLVPGDTVTLTVPLTVTAVGKNLAGTIELNGSELDVTDFGGHLAVSYDVAPTPEAGVRDETDGTVSFLRSEMGDNSIQAVGKVTFTLAEAATFSEAEDATAVLSEVEFVTNQVRPTDLP